MEYIFLLIFGICITILGIFNLKGNISTIHWYNRLKITKENSKEYKALLKNAIEKYENYEYRIIKVS